MDKPRRMSVIDRTGHRYGRLTVTERAPNYICSNGKPVTRRKCLCDCGNSVIVAGPSLAKGAKGLGQGTRSCGCLAKEKPIKHGMWKTPLYSAWSTLVQRCTNPKSNGYLSYGARGITLADEWLDFSNFYRDMGDRPHGASLDRIDNTKGYSKDNCRWATRKQQANNRSTNTFLTLNGKKHTMAEWAEITGLGKACLGQRLRSGMSPELALTLPKAPRGKRLSLISKEI